MGLDAQGTKTHGACHEMLHDALYTFYLIYWGWRRSLLPTKEITDKDGRLFLVDELCPFLKLLIRALTGGQLQLGDGLWVPSVLDTVLTPSKLPLIRE